MILVISSIFLYLLFLISNNKNKRSLFILSMGIFASLLLLTNGQFAGADYPDYLKLYLGNHEDSMYGDLDIKGGYELEWPYAFYVRLVRLVLPRMAYSYIICYALMWIIPLWLLIKKGSYNAPLSILLIVTCLGCYELLFIIAAHRQMIANVSLLWAYYILTYTEYKRKKKIILVSLLSIVALFAHSSSYFVIPLLLLVYYMKLPKRNIIIALILLSYIIGPYLQTFFQPLFYGLMASFGSSEEIARSTRYFIENTYNNTSDTWSRLLPFTLFGMAVMYFSSNNELKGFGPKLIAFSTVFYNFFNSIPLVNRALMIFIILGVILSIPKSLTTKNKNVRITFMVIGLMLVIVTIRTYTNWVHPLLPYPYVWDDPSPFVIYSF